MMIIFICEQEIIPRTGLAGGDNGGSGPPAGDKIIANSWVGNNEIIAIFVLKIA